MSILSYEQLCFMKYQYSLILLTLQLFFDKISLLEISRITNNILCYNFDNKKKEDNIMDTNMQPLEFVMLVGIPACGKSTLSKEYLEKGYTVLSSDQIRIELAGNEEVFQLEQRELNELNGKVFEYIRKKAYECLKAGKSVLIDATNLGRKKRKNFVSHIRRVKCNKKCIFFITHKDICFERNQARTGIARVPDYNMNNMLRNFEAPYYWEGWDEIVPIIDNTPYSFPFEEAKTFNQDNPYHHHTLFDHMDIARQYAVDNNFADYIVKALKYHDVGKLYVKEFKNRRGEETKFAHYYGHENYSAYLYLMEMCCGKELTDEEFKQILYEANLINCHMRPLVVWKDTPSAKKNDKELFGEQFMSDLMQFHEADRFAH